MSVGFNRGFPVLGDLELTADGRDLQLVTGAAKVAQNLKVRLATYRGSWRYDRQIGMPYFQEILVAGPSLELIRRRFYDTIIRTEGVATVQSLALRIARETGTLFVDFSVVTDSGALVQETLDFVLSQ